jgi:GTP-binding protein HflX
MIDAFKSTLHELAHSALILLVLDISEPIDDVARKLYSSINLMNELKVPMTKVIYLLNKADLISNDNAIDKSMCLGILDSKKYVLSVSAKTGLNIDQLKNLVLLLVFHDNWNGKKIVEEQMNLVNSNESISS